MGPTCICWISAFQPQEPPVSDSSQGLSIGMNWSTPNETSGTGNALITFSSTHSCRLKRGFHCHHKLSKGEWLFSGFFFFFFFAGGFEQKGSSSHVCRSGCRDGGPARLKADFVQLSKWSVGRKRKGLWPVTYNRRERIWCFWQFSCSVFQKTGPCSLLSSHSSQTFFRGPKWPRTFAGGTTGKTRK